MKKLWKQAIRNLEGELPDEFLQSLIRLSAPRGFINGSSPNQFEIEISSPDLLRKINKQTEQKIKEKLQGCLEKEISIHFSAPLPRQHSRPVAWLNPSFTYNSFLQSPSNQLACLASEAVIMQLGRSNPFYIYGDPGMGKTHLVHAMAHQILQEYPMLRIYYSSFSDFKEAFSDSLANRSILDFKKSIKEYDILILENTEEISSSPKSITDDFFHLFNHFYDNGKQIVFTSSVEASALNLKGSLKSRLLSGLQVQLLPPDSNLSKALILRRVKEYDLKLTQALTQKLLDYQPSSVRELEAILNRLYFLKEKGIKVQNVAQIQKNFIELFHETDEPIFSIDLIVDTVCKKFNITREQILGNSRKAEFTLPRHIAMYLAVKYSDYNKSAIARYFKKNDHTTVINAEKNISRRIQKERGFNHTLDQIVNQLRIRCV